MYKLIVRPNTPAASNVKAGVYPCAVGDYDVQWVDQHGTRVSTSFEEFNRDFYLLKERPISAFRKGDKVVCVESNYSGAFRDMTVGQIYAISWTGTQHGRPKIEWADDVGYHCGTDEHRNGLLWHIVDLPAPTLKITAQPDNTARDIHVEVEKHKVSPTDDDIHTIQQMMARHEVVVTREDAERVARIVRAYFAH